MTHARVASCWLQPRHMDSCQASTATGCRKTGKLAEHTPNGGTAKGAKERPTWRGVPPGTHRRCPHGRQRPQGHAHSGECRPHTRTSHPEPVFSGPRLHTRRTGGQGRESALSWTSLTEARGAGPWAPSCRPHSAQRQFTRACAVGLVTAPMPAPHVPKKKGSRPRPRARRTGGRPRENTQALKPPREAGGAPHPSPKSPSGHPHSAQWQLARACPVGLLTGPPPAPPAPKQKGQWAPAARSKDAQSGEGESPTLDGPQGGNRRHPPGAPLTPPHSTTPAGRSVCCGGGNGPQRPHHTAQRERAADPGCTPKGRAVWEGECQ